MSLLEPVVRASAMALEVVGQALADPETFRGLLRELGWEVPVSDGDLAAINRFLPIADSIGQLMADVDSLDDKSGAERIEVVVALALSAKAIFDAIVALADLDATDLEDLEAPLDDPALWAEVADDLPHILAVNWLQTNNPSLFGLLLGGGIVNPTQSDDTRRTRWRIDWAALGTFVSDPVAHLKSLYGWGTRFQHWILMNRLARLLAGMGVSIIVRRMNGREASAIGVDIDGEAPPVSVIEARLFHGRGQLAPSWRQE